MAKQKVTAEEQRARELKKQRARELNKQQREEAMRLWRQEEGLIRERDMPLSRTACWRLRRAQKLTALELNGRIFYRRSEVEALLRPVESGNQAA
jgi:hypothetical protein